MRKLKLFLSMLLLTAFSIGNVWAETWVMFPDGGNFNSSWEKTTRTAKQNYAGKTAIQLMGKNKGVTGEVTSKSAFTGISAISVNCTANKALSMTLSYSADGTNWTDLSTKNIAQNASGYTDYDLTITDIPSTAVYVKLATSGNSIYLYSVTIETGSTEPAVYVDPTEIDFGEVSKDADASETFTLTAENLTSGLTIEASEGFYIYPDELTAADAMAEGGVVIEVSPVTYEKGEKTGTITISGDDLDEAIIVPVSVNVVAVYYTVGVAVNDGAMGTATINDEASISTETDENFTLVATPNEGYRFDHWEYDDNSVYLEKDDAATTTASLSDGGNATITAVFVSNDSPELTVNVDELDFGYVDVKSEPEIMSFTITGSNLTGDVTLTIEEYGSAGFEISATSFTKEEVMAEGGVTVEVTSVTNKAGNFSPEITISTEGTAPKTVELYLAVDKIDAEMNWSASTATADIDLDNTYPTLTKPEDATVTYSSSNTGVATIDPEGAITLVAPGTTTITASIKDDDIYENANESYELTVVKYSTARWYVNGEEVKTQTITAGSALSFPADPVASGDCEGLVFRGWAESELAAKTDEAPAFTALTAMPAADVDFYAVFATETSETTDGDPEWVATAYADLATGDVVVITSEKEGTVRAMSNNKGTSAAPTATEVTVTEGKLSAAPAEELQWDVEKDGEGNATFYVHGSTESWLYCTDTNNGVRVGSNTNTTFSISNDYLYHNGTTRYLGVYNSQDWRCYGSINSNIQNQTLAFYKQQATKQTVTSYSGYMTTCESCSKVTFTTSATENGTYNLSATSVRTCDGVTTVNVTFAPADGYELASFSVEQVEGVSYADGVITIAQGFNGTVQTSASFKQADYTVTMEQTGGAEAAISADQADKHFGETINISAEDKAGYVFLGWEATPAVTFADASALTTTFAMPASNVTVTAKYAKVYTLAELATAGLDVNTVINVKLDKDVIKSIYEYKSQPAGVTFDVQINEGEDLRIFFNNQETISDWQVGGKLSGIMLNAKLGQYSGEWQIVPAYGFAWADLTYEDPSQGPATALDNVADAEKPVKVLREGKIFILKGDKTFDITGQLVK